MEPTVQNDICMPCFRGNALEKMEDGVAYMMMGDGGSVVSIFINGRSRFVHPPGCHKLSIHLFISIFMQKINN